MRYQPKRRYIKQFAFALEKVYVPGAEIDMRNIEPGDCSTPGCFGWLTLRALEFISGKPRRDNYGYAEEATALSHFLETGEVLTRDEVMKKFTVTSTSPLTEFAASHPRWWGGPGGDVMYSSSSAFSPTGEWCSLKESDLVAWMIAVSRRPVPRTREKS